MLAMDDEAMMRAELILQSGASLTDDLIGIPNPSPNISKAVRLGWYFHGYLSDMLTEYEVNSVSCVAKGVLIGVDLVEDAPAELHM